MYRLVRFMAGLVAVPFVALLLLGGGSGTEGTTAQYEYVLPTGVMRGGHTVTVPVMVAPCGVAPCPGEDVVFGNPVFLKREPIGDLSVAFEDDHYEDAVAATVCMRDERGFCTEDSFGPFCQPFALTVLPRPAVTAVHAYSIVLNDDLGVCGATKGTVTVTWS